LGGCLVYETINHGVEDASSALACGVCHANLNGGPLRLDLINNLGYGLKGSTLQVCTQCHENKGDMSFIKVHDKHVSDKGVDCSACHKFSRPERGLTQISPNLSMTNLNLSCESKLTYFI
jgi:uncharacterized CHY-type Zn-finger protein